MRHIAKHGFLSTDGKCRLMRIHVSAQILHTADTEGKWTSFTQARKYSERQMMFFVFCSPPPAPFIFFSQMLQVSSLHRYKCVRTYLYPKTNKLSQGPRKQLVLSSSHSRVFRSSRIFAAGRYLDIPQVWWPLSPTWLMALTPGALLRIALEVRCA